MMKHTKQIVRPYIRAVQGSYRAMRRSISASAPIWFTGRINHILDYVDLHIVDHGVFRLIYSNRHKLSPLIWRSSQPSPREIRVLARRGLKTVINLRGDRDCGSYRLERTTCQRKGVHLINFTVRSRAAPLKETIFAAKELFASIEYPALMHCKSGADRVGLMSALYMIFQEGRPVVEAKKQLSLRYGHIRQADTGILDSFFDTYLKHSSDEPIAFLDWINRYYDPEELTLNFKARSAANILINKVIKRE